MSPMRIFRAAPSPLKRQCVWTLVFVASIVVVHAADSGSAGTGSTWFTPQNILTAVALIYGAGMLREQFLDVRARLLKTEQELKTFAEQTVPETYVRQDVLDERLRPIEDQLRPTPWGMKGMNRGEPS